MLINVISLERTPARLTVLESFADSTHLKNVSILKAVPHLRAPAGLRGTPSSAVAASGERAFPVADGRNWRLASVAREVIAMSQGSKADVPRLPLQRPRSRPVWHRSLSA
jgi:hypothetical protein